MQPREAGKHAQQRLESALGVIDRIVALVQVQVDKVSVEKALGAAHPKLCILFGLRF